MLQTKIALLTSLFLCLILQSGLFAVDYERSENGLNGVGWQTGASDFDFADINKDGHVDFVSIGDHGSPGNNQHGIMVFFSDGEGGWQIEMNGNFGYGGVAVGDVNNDGDWDVGYGMHHANDNDDFGNQLIEVVLGDGSGENWEPWDNGLAVPRGNDNWWGMFGTDFGDFNNDGLLDLGSVAFGSGTGLHLYSNNGDGSWESVLYYYDRENSLFEIYFGDIDNNGNLDLACNLQDTEVLFGDGEGNWEDGRHNLPAPVEGAPYWSVDLGDVDGDGGDDLAFINADFGLDVYSFDVEEDEWISLSDNLPREGTYQQLDLCDMDMDNDLDLVASTREGLEVWLQDPEGDDRWELGFEWQANDNVRRSRALRSGGDVDHNGLPEIILLMEYQNGNQLCFFVETSDVDELWINSVDPQGGEMLKAGSVRFIDWTAAIPDRLDPEEAEVNLYFSANGEDGNWIEIVEDYTNGGRYQWTVPQRVSDDCYIKYELTIGDETVEVVTPAPFSIFGAVDPVLNVSPERLHFIIPIGESAEQEVTITNVGGDTLEVEPLELQEGVVFSHNGGDEGFSLEANEERVITITFAPEEAGEYDDIFRVSSNGGEAEVVLTARTGVPGPPDLVASPDTLDFGRVLVDDAATRRLLIQNEGETAAVLSVDVPDEGVFHWDAIEDMVINPGAVTSFVVGFEPNAADEFATEITLRYQEGEINIPLFGIGTLSLLIEFSDDTLDFGRVIIDSSSSRDLIIYNRGEESISLYIPEPENNLFTWRTTGWHEIRVDGQLILTVSFNPDSPSVEISELEISVRGEENRFNIILLGEGIRDQSVKDERLTPVEFGILSVSPNPFNEVLQIKYAIDHHGKTTLSVIDLSGRKVGIIDDVSNTTGIFVASFNAAGLVSGTYVIQLQQGGKCEAVKVVYVR